MSGESSPGASARRAFCCDAWQKRGWPAQEIGEEAASLLLEDLQTGTCVDDW